MQFVLGVVFLICSTPDGMAKKFIPAEARASFSLFSESQSQDALSVAFEEASDGRDALPVVLEEVSDGRDVLPVAFLEHLFDQNGEAVLSEGDGGESEGSESKVRNQKRPSHRQGPTFGRSGPVGAFVFNRLSFSSLEKGYPRSPLTQDAQEQRAGMIRFAQLASLAC